MRLLYQNQDKITRQVLLEFPHAF